MKDIAFIFDMDGVIIDNANHHYRAWEEFCHREDLSYQRGESKYWFGNTNNEILPRLYGRALSHEEITEKGDMKEQIYRSIIASEIEPVNGLIPLLQSFKDGGYAVAMATSAPTENVDFVVDTLGIRQYFDHIVDASGVKKGKPSPEIYMKAAALLGIAPEKCLVFEDALAGITAARAAGMKVVGLITTLDEDELNGTEKNVHDFTQVNLKDILRLLDS